MNTNRKGNVVAGVIVGLIILALLITVMVVMWNVVKGEENRAECAANILNINNTINKYVATNGNWPDSVKPFVTNIICPVDKENYEDMMTPGPFGEGSYLDTDKHEH